MSLDLSRPLVYLITAGDCEAANYPTQSKRIIEGAKRAADAGVDLFQIREKQLSADLLFEITQRVAEVFRRSQTRLLVNDRLDIALTAGAGGVHLTSASAPVKMIREHSPEGFLIGASCHSVNDVVEARRDGADFALFGPVFASPGKGNGVGLNALNKACGSEIPVLGIGGIDASNYRDVLDAGTAGFAAIRSLNDADSMRRIMEGLGR
ncbi:MAG: thiamine phosphate synthase [Acidobacteria bacterium]|nr:thiamine phosphate synthase [Acidobacteriota bacterium]